MSPKQSQRDSDSPLVTKGQVTATDHYSKLTGPSGYWPAETGPEIPPAERGRPSRLLRKARAVVADPDRFCQGAWARTADGTATTAFDTQHHERVGQPVAYCAEEALALVQGLDPGPWDHRAHDLLWKASYSLFEHRPWDVNEMGHAEVLRMYDEAIRLAKEAGW